MLNFIKNIIQIKDELLTYLINDIDLIINKINLNKKTYSLFKPKLISITYSKNPNVILNYELKNKNIINKYF